MGLVPRGGDRNLALPSALVRLPVRVLLAADRQPVIPEMRRREGVAEREG